MRLRGWFGFIVVIGITGSPALAADWRFSIDNDYVTLDDGDYTNGLFVSRIAAPRSAEPRAGQALSWTWGLHIGQQMWTPDDIKKKTPQPDERPYAGLLFIEPAFYWGAQRLRQRAALKVGILGPDSGAEAVQKAAHKVFPAPAPEGWDFQVRNTPVIQASWDGKYLLYRQSHWEFSLRGRAAAGNFRSELEFGPLIRFGINLDHSFNSFGLFPRFQPESPWWGQNGQGYYLYTGLIGRYRFNDETIEGDLPSEVPRVDIKHEQASATVGGVYYWQRFGIGFRFVGYTKEYEQASRSIRGFGGLDFLWRW